jgi:hypothetical protein
VRQVAMEEIAAGEQISNGQPVEAIRGFRVHARRHAWYETMTRVASQKSDARTQLMSDF